jgi:hypothetical protein
MLETKQARMFFSYKTTTSEYCTQLHYPFFPATALAHAVSTVKMRVCQPARGLLYYVACLTHQITPIRAPVPSLPLRQAMIAHAFGIWHLEVSEIFLSTDAMQCLALAYLARSITLFAGRWPARC